MTFPWSHFLLRPSENHTAIRVGVVSQKGILRIGRMKLCAAAACILFLPAALARGQTSQILFDAPGNLLVQTSETIAPPAILGQPQNQIVAPGELASFSVVVADTRGVGYNWFFNGTPIPGATNDALLLTNVNATNEGQYFVTVSNTAGFFVASDLATLFIDSDGDGLPDSWEITFFGTRNPTATGDFDGDGVSNLQEFLDGTNPTNSASALYRITLLSDGGAVTVTPNQPSYTNGASVTLTATPSGAEPFHAWTGDVLTRSNVITLTMTNNKTLFAHFGPVVFAWTNNANGDWNTASNWTPNLVPSSNDTVFIVIANNPTVTLNTDADLADFTLGNGVMTPTLTGNGVLTIRGNCYWKSGSMSGSGRTTIETGGTLLVANPINVSLNSRTLENGGTAAWTGNGGIGMNNAVFTNRIGASFDVAGSGLFLFQGGVNRFDNVGTFRKLSAGTTSFSGIAFNNYNLAQIQSGTLSLDGGGLNNGTMDLPAGTSLILGFGTFTASASSSIAGAGQFTVNGASATLAGLVNVRGTNTFSNGTANLTGNYTCTNNTLILSGGVANFDGTGTVSPAVVSLSGGTLGGANTVTVGSVMNWTGGSMTGTGRTIISPAATLSIISPLRESLVLTAHTLENGGNVVWTGPGDLGLNGAVITNRAGALFDVQNASGVFIFGGSPRFDNAGTLRKSAGGATFMGIPFTNSGTVDIRSGILAANSGYVSSSNALLNCTLGGTTAGTGFGQLQVAGTVTLNGALGVDLINGFLPATNDLFTVVSAASRTGAFGSFSYPSNVATMLISNTPNSVIVRVTAVATPPPILLPPEISGPNLRLIWTAISNTTYRLEFNPNLNPSNWNALLGDVTTLSNTASKLDPLTSSNRFYRVRVLP